jgi:predicted hydrocarbon binding protein
MSLSLRASGLTAFPHASLRALRAALVRDLGDGFAAVLQEAGHAGGEAVLEGLRRWCRAEGMAAPESLAYAEFQHAAARYFSEAGWGSVRFEAIGDVAIAVDSPDWAEGEPGAKMPFPSCYYSAGMLATVFGGVADGGLQCFEVECRSHEGERCRFLLASPEVIGHVYQRMNAGVGYVEALAELG